VKFHTDQSFVTINRKRCDRENGVSTPIGSSSRVGILCPVLFAHRNVKKTFKKTFKNLLKTLKPKNQKHIFFPKNLAFFPALRASNLLCFRPRLGLYLLNSP